MSSFRALVCACIFINVYYLEVVSSAECCQMTMDYILSAKIQGQNPVKDECGQYKDIDTCVSQTNIGTCEWFCYLKLAKDQPKFDFSGIKKPTLPLKITGEKKYTFKKDEISALESMDRSSSKYYSAYQLLTYDETGKAELYDFNPTFINNHKMKEIFTKIQDILKQQESQAIAKVAKTKSGKDNAAIMRAICAEAALKHSSTIYTERCIDYTGPLQIQRAQTVMRRLIDHDEDIDKNGTRRRLTVGIEEKTGIGFITKTPYSSVGLLFFEFNDGADKVATGVGAIIKSVLEDDNIQYDYILTAGHNCYEHTGDVHKKIAWNFMFWRGLNSKEADIVAVYKSEKPSHNYNEFKRVWVPLFKGPDNHKFANDYCIIKYQVAARHNDVADFVSSDVRRVRQRLITYRQINGNGIDIKGKPYLQRYRKEVKPEVGGGLVYKIKPEYTVRGQSGSPAFIETGSGVKNIIASILVGRNEDGMDIHCRLNKDKIDTITNIITKNKMPVKRIPKAMESYGNMYYMGYYESYDDKMQSYADENYGEYEGYYTDNAHGVIDMNTHTAQNTSQYALYFVAVMLLMFGLIGCCAVSVFSGFVIGMVSSKLYKRDEEKNIINNSL
eukprot:191357_1